MDDGGLLGGTAEPITVEGGDDVPEAAGAAAAAPSAADSGGEPAWGTAPQDDAHADSREGGGAPDAGGGEDDNPFQVMGFPSRLPLEAHHSSLLPHPPPPWGAESQCRGIAIVRRRPFGPCGFAKAECSRFRIARESGAAHVSAHAGTDCWARHPSVSGSGIG